MRSILLAVLVASVAAAAEKPVKAEQVPPAVVKAAAGRHPTGKVTGYVEENDAQKKAYEVRLDVDGQKVELIVAPDGTLLEEERVVAWADLPADVTRALAASKYAKAKVGKIERVEDLHSGTPLVWELVVEEGGKRRELVFKNGVLEKDKAAGKHD
jgi:hypothetical protein